MGTSDNLDRKQYVGEMYENCSTYIILQEEYISYEEALNNTNMKSLRARRMNLITKIAKKALRSERFQEWFSEEEPNFGMVPRSKESKKLLKAVKCRTQRYERSSLPFMTKLLSWHPPLPACT